jgi:hypothetical protein
MQKVFGTVQIWHRGAQFFYEYALHRFGSLRAETMSSNWTRAIFPPEIGKRLHTVAKNLISEQ